MLQTPVRGGSLRASSGEIRRAKLSGCEGGLHERVKIGNETFL
jgi:hypothetical protein